MASSCTEDSVGMSQSEVILDQVHKVAALDVSSAKKAVRSLPLICKLLTTDIDVKGLQLKNCFEKLGFTFPKFLSMLIFSKDWKAVEAAATILCSENLMSTQFLQECLSPPDKAVIRELSAFGHLLNTKNITEDLQWAVTHAIESGSVLPLDLLLRIVGPDNEKRNCALGAEANTLLHLSCSGSEKSGCCYLPVWLLGWGIDANIPNKEGKLPVDLLAGDNILKDLFSNLSTNKWIKDLAYMNYTEIKQFLLQQFCASGQWLNILSLVEELKQRTDGDFTSVLAALEKKRNNTACKALLDIVGVNAKGLSILKSVLLETEKGPKRDLLINVMETVTWRLQYETIDIPYSDLEWLEALAAENLTDHQVSSDKDSIKEKVSVTELLQSSIWYNTDFSMDPKKHLSKRQKKAKSSSARISSKEGPKLTDYEMEVCEQLESKQNIVIFMPHPPSHFPIGAHVLKTHFASAVDVNCEDNDPQADNSKPGRTDMEFQQTKHSDGSNVYQEEKATKCAIDPANKRQTKQSINDSFYAQQKKVRSRGRRRNNTVSEETVRGQVKSENKRRHRRRTKSSSDSLRFLEDDIAELSVDEEETVAVYGEPDETVSKKAALVIVQSYKQVETTAAQLKSYAPAFTFGEHAGISKTKAGLRKLLKCNDVVVSHFAAVKCGIKARVFAMKDVSLLMFLDTFYDDDLFSLIPKRLQEGPHVVMIFKEFPYRSDMWSLDSVLSYVKSKVQAKTMHTVHKSKLDYLKIMYPGIAYTSNVQPASDLSKTVSALREHMSATFGTYGKIEGCIYMVNMDCSSADFKCQLTEECKKVLPSSFQVCSMQVTSSRKMNDQLFLISNVTDLSQNTCGSRKCNFAAFTTRCGEEIYVETVSAESSSQSCLDQLHCQQYIKVLRSP